MVLLRLSYPTAPWPVQLTVAGYSDKLEVLLMKITEKMTKLEVDQMKFLMYKDQVRHIVQTTQTIQYMYARTLCSYIHMYICTCTYNLFIVLA